MANLTALLMAHRAKSNGGRLTGLWNSAAPMTIYASEQIHMSIPKAADILGLGRAQVRLIPCDDRFRMNLSVLRQTIAGDLESGLKPFCIVGSAGTVNTGAVDPLYEIADVATEFNLGSTLMALMAHWRARRNQAPTLSRVSSAPINLARST